MWYIVQRLFVNYTRQLSLPIAGIIGFIGYYIESYISDRHTPSFDSVKEKRQERLLDDTNKNKIKARHNPLGVNLSPSLK